jgi:HEAT repeats/Putative zinc-finger
MNCQDYQRQVVLSLYEELHEGERVSLEAHLRECGECRQAHEEHQNFCAALAEDKFAWDFPSDLLVESRRALANELDNIERKRSWWRVPTFSVVFTPMRMLESATLIALGLAFGVYISNHQLSPVGTTAGLESPAAITLHAVPENGRVSNVRIVSTDSNTATVEFTGDVVQPLRFTGRLDDDTTQRLLFSAVQDSMNAGSRMQAVEVLARKSSEPSIKEMLIHALLNDQSLGVRLKAFEGLKPFAGDDDVRAAFMQTLMTDPNDGMRVAVVDALAPFTKSEAMANSIEAVTRNDDNTYVRLKGQGLIQMVGSRK